MIGIMGGSGSGKSYFLHRLLERLGEQHVSLVSQDNYYRPLDEHPLDENGVRNFDLPESIDFTAYNADVDRLIAGEAVTRQEYTFNNTARSPKQIHVASRPAVVLEGLYVLHPKSLPERIDCKVFVEAPYPVMIRRRILRDYQERGYRLDDVLYRYENHVMPAFERYLQPLKAQAHLVIPNYNTIDVALDVLANHIEAKIKLYV